MSSPRTSLWLVVSAVAVTVLAACGGSEEPVKNPEANPPPPVETAMPSAMPSADPAASAAPTAPAPSATAAVETPPTPPSLTDEQITKLVMVANTGEVDQAKLAGKNAKDAKVKKFATTMVAHHGDANKKLEGWAKKAKITPADSDMSTKLAGDSQKMVDSWKDVKGADFDKAYMEAQVKEHEMVLDALDKQLIPNAKNADLKAALTEIRGKVEAHLKEAKDIHAALAAAPAAGGAGKTDTKAPAAAPAAAAPAKK